MEQPAYVFEALRHCQSVFAELEHARRQREGDELVALGKGGAWGAK